MNLWLLASAGLIVGLGLFHSILGERYIVRRLLRREDLPKLWGDDSFTKLTLRYAWHVTTILAFVAAGILVYLAEGTRLDGAGVAVTRLLALAFAANGLWGLLATRARHLSWIVFLAAGGLAWAGTL